MKKPFDILLIEDNEPDKELLINQFSDIPIINKVICEPSKKAGIEHLENRGHDFGLVITDYYTPDNSPEIDKRLIETAKEYGIPTIYLSGINDSKISSRAFQNGAIACLEKPLNKGQFVAVISTLNNLGVELVKLN